MSPLKLASAGMVLLTTAPAPTLPLATPPVPIIPMLLATPPEPKTPLVARPLEVLTGTMLFEVAVPLFLAENPLIAPTFEAIPPTVLLTAMPELRTPPLLAVVQLDVLPGILTMPLLKLLIPTPGFTPPTNLFPTPFPLDTMLALETVVRPDAFVLAINEFDVMVLFIVDMKGMVVFIEATVLEFVNGTCGITCAVAALTIDTGDTFKPLTIGRPIPWFKPLDVIGVIFWEDGRAHVATEAAVAGKLRGPGYTSGEFSNLDDGVTMGLALMELAETKDVDDGAADGAVAGDRMVFNILAVSAATLEEAAMVAVGDVFEMPLLLQKLDGGSTITFGRGCGGCCSGCCGCC